MFDGFGRKLDRFLKMICVLFLIHGKNIFNKVNTTKPRLSDLRSYEELITMSLKIVLFVTYDFLIQHRKAIKQWKRSEGNSIRWTDLQGTSVIKLTMVHIVEFVAIFWLHSFDWTLIEIWDLSSKTEKNSLPQCCWPHYHSGSRSGNGWIWWWWAECTIHRGSPWETWLWTKPFNGPFVLCFSRLSNYLNLKRIFLTWGGYEKYIFSSGYNWACTDWTEILNKSSVAFEPKKAGKWVQEKIRTTWAELQCWRNFPKFRFGLLGGYILYSKVIMRKVEKFLICNIVLLNLVSLKELKWNEPSSYSMDK